jgi:hypothetical protein
MFNEPYSYRLATKYSLVHNGIKFEQQKFTFRCRHNQVYIVNLEKYESDFYVIKFYLKKHKLSPSKYSLLSGLQDMPRVMATCLKIMIDTYTKQPYASFGFIGANSLGEAENDTKRFKIYRRIMESFFSPVNFTHYAYTEKSAYLLLNKKKEQVDLLHSIENLFDAYFT